MTERFRGYFFNVAMFLAWYLVFMLVIFGLTLLSDNLSIGGKFGWAINCLISGSIANSVVNCLHRAFGSEKRLCTLDFNNGFGGFTMSVCNVGFDILTFAFALLLVGWIVLFFIDILK